MNIHRPVFALALLAVASHSAFAGDQDFSAQFAPLGSHRAALGNGSGFGADSVSSSGGYSAELPIALPPARGDLPVPFAVVHTGAPRMGTAGIGWDVGLWYVLRSRTESRRKPLFTSASPTVSATRILLSKQGALQLMNPAGSNSAHRPLAAETFEELRGPYNFGGDPEGLWYFYDASDRQYRFLKKTSTWDPEDSDLWLLDRITDRKGNYVQLEYSTQDIFGGKELRLTELSYSYNGLCPKHRIVLEYGQHDTPSTPTLLRYELDRRNVRVQSEVLTTVVVRVTGPGCTEQDVSKYELKYVDDPDSKLPLSRLRWLDLTGSDGVTQRRLREFQYESASEDGTLFRFETTVNMAPPVTDGLHMGASYLDGAEFGTTRMLADFTGDGLPDFVYGDPDEPTGEPMLLRNVAGYFDAPPTLLFPPGGPAARKLQSQTVRSATYQSCQGTQTTIVTETWQGLIDWNGDGRMDLVDARGGVDPSGDPSDDYWQVLINVPDPAGGHYWHALNVDIRDVRSMLADIHNCSSVDIASGRCTDDVFDETGPLPISRSKNGGHMIINPAQWLSDDPDGDGHCDNFTLSGEPCSENMEECFGPRREDTAHFSHTEWKLQDLNGDGFPDLVFNDQPVVAGSDDGCSFLREVDPELVSCNGEGGNSTCTPDLQCWGDPDDIDYNCCSFLGPILNCCNAAWVVRLPPENNVRVLYNKNGGHLTSQTPIEFTSTSNAPIVLEGDHCGLEMWRTDGGSPLVQLMCGFREVNGDGLIDRIHNDGDLSPGGAASISKAKLNVGVAFNGPVIELPGIADVKFSHHEDVCGARSDPEHLEDETPYEEVALASLADITGDGIQDYVLSRGSTWQVFAGTGVGYAEALPIDIAPLTFELGVEHHQCNGKITKTISGLVDLDGDGHADVIHTFGTALDIAQLRNPSDDRARNAGRLVSIKNENGLRTDIRYTSAKTEDWLSAHQIPSPEIVVSQVTQVPAKGIGTPTDSLLYAFGEIELFYQPLLARWVSTGYGRRVVLRADPSTAKPNGIGKIDEYLMPDELPRGIAAYSLGGALQRSTIIAGVEPYAWSWLAATPTFGSTREGGTERDWNLVNTGASLVTSEPECNDIDAYLFDSAGAASPHGEYLCRSAAIVVNVFDQAWRGKEPPPKPRQPARSDYLERITEVLSFDDAGRPTKVSIQNDTNIATDNYCVENTWAGGPTSSSPGVMNALATIRVTDCASTIYAEHQNRYDNLPLGQVGAGLKTRLRINNRDSSTGAALGTFDASDITYTATGRLHTITRTRSDGVTNTRTVTYDAFDLLPILIVDDASDVATDLVHSLTYDPVTLALISSGETNNSVVTMTRDAFGRPLLTKFFEPAAATEYVIGDFQYNDGTFDGTDGKSIRRRDFEVWIPAAGYSSLAPAPSGVAESTSSFDEYGRLLHVKSPLGADYSGKTLVTDYRLYDAHGRARFAADPFTEGDVEATVYGTSFHYDQASRLTCSVRGIGYRTEQTPSAATDRYPTCYTYEYDARQAVVRKRGPNELGATPGSAEIGAYDERRFSAAGRLLSTSRFSGTTRLEHSTFAYDRIGNLIQGARAVNPAGGPVVSWQMHFDSLGRVISIEEPGTAARTLSYDEWGGLLSATWSSGGSVRGTSYQYDGFGRVKHSAPILAAGDPPLPTYDYHYDVSSGDPLRQPSPTNLKGRLSWATDGRVSTYFSYDALGNATRSFHWDSVDALLFRESHAYGPSGARDSITFSMPDTVALETATYSYDSARRLKRIDWSDAAGPAADPVFLATDIDVFGRYRKAEYGNDARQELTYRPDRRRELQERQVISSAGVRRYSFPSYDGEGRILIRREMIGASPVKQTVYSYDALEQLQRAVETTGAATTLDETFAYDALGNLRLLTDALTPANSRWLTPDAVDPDRACRIANTPPPPFFPPCNYSHDPLGNVASAPDTDGIARTFTYDPSSRILRIVKGGAEASFRWGPFGNINVVDVTGAGASNRRERNYGPLIQRAQYGASWVIERRIPGPSGVVAIRRGHGPSAEVIFPHADGNGLRNATGAGATESQVLTYRPFGSVITDTAVEGSISDLRRKWNGGELFKAFGVTQLGARLYDAPTGRFLQRDPLVQVGTAGSVHPYAFAANDPINLSDPSGLCPPCGPVDQPNGTPFDFTADNGGYYEPADTGPEVVYEVETSREAPRTARQPSRESWWTDMRQRSPLHVQEGYFWQTTKKAWSNVSTGLVNPSQLGPITVVGVLEEFVGRPVANIPDEVAVRGRNVGICLSNAANADNGWEAAAWGAQAVFEFSVGFNTAASVAEPFVVRTTPPAVVPPRTASVWASKPFDRGVAIERALGQNLPQNFPTIDRFSGGLATSIKSLDLDAATYQSISALDNTVAGYIDDVAAFNGKTWAGVEIQAHQVTGRALDLAVPHGGNAAQQAALQSLVDYGASVGVTVNIIVYP